MKLATITSYCGDKNRVSISIESGAEHLILEDSKVSLRSYTDNFKSPDFSHIIELATYARSLDPNIELSAQCDLLVHDRHFPTLERFYTAVQEAKIHTIRVQDQGLITYFKSCAPDLDIIYMQESGNHNTYSAEYFSQCVKGQVLSNELTATEIDRFVKNISCNFEIQVHGPILIQYSNRRFMTGLDETKDTDDTQVLSKYAYDKDYPGREFIFLDNPHGHFMYVYFDRSLIRYIPQLYDLHLNGWIIDARGESDAYLKTTLSSYKTLRDSYQKNPSNWDTPIEAIKAIDDVSRRPQKAGFFRANQTDKGRKSPYADLPENTRFIGTVKDVIKDKKITLELEEPLSIGDLIYISSPRKVLIELKVSHITATEYDAIVQLRWHKGVLAKSKVYKL
jgi:U32 family peptidase